MKRDGFDESPSRCDVALEISGQGKAEAGNDIIVGGGDLLQVDHIRLCKDTASSGNPGRVLRPQCQFPELLDGQTQTAGLLVQKRARSRRAKGVHGEIADLEVSIRAIVVDQDELGILSPHVDYGSYFRVEKGDRLSLRYDFVHELPAQELSQKFSARSR